MLRDKGDDEMECLHRSEERLLNAAPAVAPNLLQRLLDDIGYVPILLAAAVLVCFTGNALIKITDPVESNYALTAMEMLQSGDYVSPRIFGNYWYDKPVLFYWELMAAFSLFGTTDFAARFFPVSFRSTMSRTSSIRSSGMPNSLVWTMQFSLAVRFPYRAGASIREPI